jgi:hypothetical protein
VFQNRCLRKIFGPEKDEASEKKIRYCELRGLNGTIIFVRLLNCVRIWRAGLVGKAGETIRILIEKPLGTRPLRGMREQHLDVS